MLTMHVRATMFVGLLTVVLSAVAESLPSWNSGEPKQALIEFLARVTRESSPDYVKPAERIAVFDNDGTLWAEQPIYFQLAFAVDRIRKLAPLHPEWKTAQPFKGALEGDASALAASGERGLAQILAASHASSRWFITRMQGENLHTTANRTLAVSTRLSMKRINTAGSSST